MKESAEPVSVVIRARLTPDEQTAMRLYAAARDMSIGDWVGEAIARQMAVDAPAFKRGVRRAAAAVASSNK